MTGELHLSERAVELSGCAPGDAPSTLAGWFEHIHPDDRQKGIDAIRAHLQGRAACDFEARVRAGGEERWLRVRGRAQREAGIAPLRIAGSVTDVTEARRAARALREAEDAAARANEAKSELLAHVSHEIRTPLNAIVGAADLLVKKARLDDLAREYLDLFRDASLDLLRIANDILDLAKLEAHLLELQFVPFDLSEIAAQAAEAFAARASAGGPAVSVRVAPGVPRFLVGDPARIRQVLIHLLTHAVKRMVSGEVMLDVRPGARGAPGEILVSVSHTGPGAPEDGLDSLFDGSSQIDPPSKRSQDGACLGLAIARGLVELMGGRMWADRRAAGGTVIHFAARFGKAQPVVPSRQHVTPDAAAPRRILLAEDHPDNRILVLAYLKGTPHHLSVVEDGVEAVGLFKTGSFDLVLMDIQMPVMNGYDATREIRAWERENGQPPVPILALTAYAMEEEIDRTREAGCTAHIAKPFTKRRLLEAILEHPPVAAPGRSVADAGGVLFEGEEPADRVPVDHPGREAGEH